MKYQSINPATEKEINTYETHTDEEVRQKLEATQTAFETWSETTINERSTAMKRVAGVLRNRKSEFAHLITEEMGKPLNESQGEMEKCAWVCEYYAEHAHEFLADETLQTDASKSYVSYQPLGIILTIMPWNYPFWQVFRFAAPGLMAGNATLLKHAPNVPGCAQAIEFIFAEAGFPASLLTNLYVSDEQVSELLAHPLIKAVTLTGSTRAGKSVAEQAGKALKKCVLELGGNDPYIFLEDADLDAAIKLAVASRLKNNGQSCISAKRFIVPTCLRDAFEAKLMEEIDQYYMGEPTEDQVALGPMAGKKYRDTLHHQVLRTIEAGATCILGGVVPEGTGFYYPPTVLIGVEKGMPAYEEELFGPVFTVIYVADEEEAIMVANDTAYGLGAAIFSNNEKRAEQIASNKIRAGSCFVNEQVSSDPRLPFGGINDSGFGRELSYHGIREFVNVKTVFVK